MASTGGSNAGASASTQDDQVWNPETKAAFELKSRSEFLDPCQEAAQRSIRCLNRNDGDRTMCQDYFQAYRDCKKHWVRSLPCPVRESRYRRIPMHDDTSSTLRV
ncbi:hypothetical protein V8F20_009002 [Naviculisporaceae sp. PSN 640]